MALKIELKRSSVPGKVPTTSSLELGEMAINTYDGKLFFKQNVSGTESIVEVATTSGSILSASYANNAGNANTATSSSYALNATSASYALIATSASYAEGYVTLNTNQIITGSKTFNSVLNARNIVLSTYDSSNPLSIYKNNVESVGIDVTDVGLVGPGSSSNPSINVTNLTSNSTGFRFSAGGQNQLGYGFSVENDNGSFNGYPYIYEKGTSTLFYVNSDGLIFGQKAVITNGITGSLLGTASYAINSITSSYADNFTVAGTLTAQKIIVQTISSSIIYSSGSNIFGDELSDTHRFTGSVSITGSNTLIGTNTLTGSLNISGSETIQGYIQFLPVNTNIDTTISSSYIYVSGSTNDLYFSQNGNGYNNVTRLRWLEGNLYTGLLSGGIITVTTGSTTFNLSSGSGIIVDLNASVNDDPYPTIQYVNWGNFTSQPLTYLTSSIQTYIGIDSGGQITQQTTAFNNGIYNQIITIGTVLHQNKSTVNASITYPNVAYGYKQRTYDFIKAFGALKLSGLNIIPSGSLGLNVGSGTAFADGRNYQIDQNNPSYITDPGTTVSKIFRYYQSGSEFIQDTNNGAGYTVIDPLNYNPDGLGTLTAVPGTGSNRRWSIQRIFWYPNSATKGIVVYYGTQTYTNEIDAAANITYEQFQEVENTKQNAVYLGAIAVRNNADFTDSTSYRIFPGGIFRNVGGSGGGGNITSLLLSQLGDVTITGPTNNQPLVYDSTTTKWVNKSFISASLQGNADTATTASYALIATSASYAQTSSYANNFKINNTLDFAGTLTDYATVNSSINGLNNLFTQPTGSFTSAFFKYTVSNGSNTRAGEVITAWNNSTTEYTDFSTVDLGTTNDVTSSVSLISGKIQFNIQTNSSGWKIKSIGTFI